MSSVAASLFVYGTLMSPNLINRVIGRVPKMVPAVLHNFHRYKIQDRPYPGIAEAKGSRVEGMFIESLDDEEFSKLDEYENIEYERIPVEVQLACNDTERQGTTTYRWRSPSFLYGSWSYEKDFLPIEEEYIRTHCP
jgi:gamma-glutamylcyclotransferase (GGCT)/AIG2-like uncharacterized protein YtfP